MDYLNRTFLIFMEWDSWQIHVTQKEAYVILKDFKAIMKLLDSWPKLNIY